MKQFPKRGEIFWVNLDPTIGTETTKTRPAVILSNNIGNELSSRVIVAPITSSVTKIFPFEVPIDLIKVKGKVLLDQLRTIDKLRLGRKIGTCENTTLKEIANALKIVLDLR